MDDSADQTPGSVVMLTGDLMFASRVKAAAEQAGLTYRMGANLPEDHASKIRFVILDLSTRGKLITEIAEQCQARCPQAKLIAYGPHVHVEKIQLAKQSGIPTVMTNGQFNGQLATMFTS